MLQSDIPALSIFKQHRGVVEDVAWHHTSPNTFGSVGDDKLALLWDKRASGELPACRLPLDGSLGSGPATAGPALGQARQR